MGFDHEKKHRGETSCDKKEKKVVKENQQYLADQEEEDLGYQKIGRQMSEASLDAATDQEEDDDHGNNLQLGPQYTLKEQLEKDKVCIFLLQ